MVLANLGNVSPPLFNLITLITYLFSLLLCACLACPCACLCLPTVAHTSTLPGVLAYQHTWFCLFWISFRSFVPSHQSFFVFFYLTFFHSPPTPCRSLFTFSTLEFFPTCFSQLPFSACLLSVLPLPNHQCCHFSAIRLNTGIFLDWPIREILSLCFLPNRTKVSLFCYSARYRYPYFQVEIEMANTGNRLFTFPYIM